MIESDSYKRLLGVLHIEFIVIYGCLHAYMLTLSPVFSILAIKRGY